MFGWGLMILGGVVFETELVGIKGVTKDEL